MPQLALFGAAVDLHDLVRARPELFRSGFAAWLADNLHVWRAFEREADRIWSRGRRHWSARTILEYLRHQTAITDTDQVFRLNNNSQGDLARLYILSHPDRAGFFETRVQAGSERVA